MLIKKSTIELKKEDIVAEATLDKKSETKAEKEAAKEEKKENANDSKAESKPTH